MNGIKQVETKEVKGRQGFSAMIYLSCVDGGGWPRKSLLTIYRFYPVPGF